MPDDRMHACSYQVLRYTPNLVRDEWVNIGVLLHDPATQRVRVRLIDDVGEFARVRRLHPGADEGFLRRLQADFDSQFSSPDGQAAAQLARLNATLSNVLQLSPQRGVLTEDFDAELDRIYRDQVSPPPLRRAAAEFEHTRAAICNRANQVFRAAGILGKLQRRVPVAQYTEAGDPFHFDYAYRSNGTHGFLHALALSRDPAQAKVLAYTVEHMQSQIAESEFFAITDVEHQPANERHRFLSGLLARQHVKLVSVHGLQELAARLGPSLH